MPCGVEPVFNCVMGSYQGHHNYNNERAVHVCEFSLNDLPTDIHQVKANSANSINAKVMMDGVWVNAAVSFENNSYVFTWSDLTEYLNSKPIVRFYTKWNVGHGEGFTMETVKIYINDKLEATIHHSELLEQEQRIINKSYFDYEPYTSIQFPLNYLGFTQINSLKIVMTGEMDPTSDLFRVDSLCPRIRPFYAILNEVVEDYFNDNIDLEECMTQLRERLLALPAYSE